MNSSQLIKQISERSGIKESDVKKVFHEFNISITEAFVRLQTVKINGLYKMEPTTMPSKTMISNLKKEKDILEIASKIKIKLTISNNLQELLNKTLTKESQVLDIKEYFKQFNLD